MAGLPSPREDPPDGPIEDPKLPPPGEEPPREDPPLQDPPEGMPGAPVNEPEPLV